MSLNQLNRLGHVRATLTQFNFKLELHKELDQEVLRLKTKKFKINLYNLNIFCYIFKKKSDPQHRVSLLTSYI
jgi:hypothetical protein